MQRIYEIDKPSLDNNALMLYETLFHNANGYIGVRSCFEEGYPKGYTSVRGSYINGFYDIAPMNQAEKLHGLVEEKQTMLNIADTQGISLIIDGEKFNMFSGDIVKSIRRLDMDAGVTERRVTWRSPKGKEIEISIKRMASFTQLPLFVTEYAVKALNFDGEVEFVSTHKGDVLNYFNPDDPRVAGESFNHLVPFKAWIADGASYLASDTVRSGLRCCTAVKNVLQKPGSIENKIDGHSAVCSISTTISKDETVTLVKYTVFCDSRRYEDCISAVVSELEKALSHSLKTLYDAQREYLTGYWDRVSLTLVGNSEVEDLSLAVNYNLYQLLQSVSKDSFGNIAAKGLSGEGYEGHFFWDTEMYVQPFFSLTCPEISKSLIEYRYAILDKARENAKLLGHKRGALYPWRTIAGSECSGYFPSGTAQYHINSDIAYSIVTYYLVTKDFDFIVSKGAEIIFETARLWLDVGNFHDGRFYINCVTGPDEYTCLVNNNYFTNVSAQFNLHWAVKLYRMLEAAGKLGEVKFPLSNKEIADFELAEKTMYLPYDDELKINPQDDSFLTKPIWDIKNTSKEKFPLLLHHHPLQLYRYQVCKQADTVLAHFIHEDAQPLNVIRNSFDYYEKITTHDSSLSACIFSIVASKLGLTDKAYAYFGDSAMMDLFNTHGNTKDGIHTANMGGSYMTIVYGFGGLRVKERGLHFAPYVPAKWEGYKFRIYYEGSRIEVEVGRNESTFTLLSGEPKNIFVYNKECLLSEKLIVRKKYSAIIFDLDGVICHTDKYHYQAWKCIADKLGIYFDEEINNRLRGVSRMESFQIILERYKGIMPDEEKVKYTDEKNEIYKKLLENMTPADVSVEVLDTLERLRGLGLKLAIGSSSKNARFILNRIGLNSYFDEISDGNNISNSKPDPEVFIKACEFLNHDPAYCLVVEDAKAGLEAAIAGGMACAAVGDAIKSGLADYNLEKFSDLLQAVVAVDA